MLADDFKVTLQSNLQTAIQNECEKMAIAVPGLSVNIHDVAFHIGSAAASAIWELIRKPDDTAVISAEDRQVMISTGQQVTEGFIEKLQILMDQNQLSDIAISATIN